VRGAIYNVGVSPDSRNNAEPGWVGRDIKKAHRAWLAERQLDPSIHDLSYMT